MVADSAARPTVQTSVASRDIETSNGCNAHPENAVPVHSPTPAAMLRQRWRKTVRNFTPSWFSVNMGTGISSILLHQLPFQTPWLHYVSYTIFGLNVLLFCIFLGVSTVRYAMYPEIWHAMIRHPAQSLFIGTFPMALATIVNMFALACVPAWGGGSWMFVWALWWIDIAVSVATCFYLPFVIITVHALPINNMTAAWLLPIVGTIVASASGGIVAQVLPHPQHAEITMFTSYVLWGTGVPLAMCVLTIYLYRLTQHSVPPKEVIVSTFLPLDPSVRAGLPYRSWACSATNAGDILYIVGFLVAIVMWGFGLVWLFIALASIVKTHRQYNGFPFNIGWWGFTFPLGVFATSTVQMAKDMPSMFSKVLGTMLSLSVVLLWIIVSFLTLRKAYTGTIIVAPCLETIEAEKRASKEEKLELEASLDK
ncbi:hypothetical protein K431DRAFT_338617 [Polychaeton citri CBS 116435]|uniref:Sulfite efflux pump SSU1 n=1 Tax=Polychaeton citri CBS 116435 TaxID=1314669 RepID=A0A9P4Q9M5_9PEZI|nr:hypothetical protein K431DRAFT_338617 [Polychaeton citri CBS 116435]